MSTMTEAEQVRTDEYGAIAAPEKIAHALRYGGRAVVTVRSLKTGHHVTINLVCRKRKPSGQGWVSRATKAGRLGIAEGAEVVEVRDPDLEYGENYVGRFYVNDGEWRAGRGADAKRVWTAERVIGYALAGTPLPAEVFLATQCSFCGKKLTDPESVERGIGPECYGMATRSRSASRGS